MKKIGILLSCLSFTGIAYAELNEQCICETCECTYEKHCGCMAENAATYTTLETTQTLAGCGKCGGKGCKCRPTGRS
jgi:hypothetical protein